MELIVCAVCTPDLSEQCAALVNFDVLESLCFSTTYSSLKVIVNVFYQS